MQRAATTAIKDTLYYDTDPASALVAIDLRTGAIKTMTAVTPGHSGNQFNLAAQARRQAGLDLQDLRADEGRRPQGIQPGHDVLSLGAAPLPAHPYVPGVGRRDLLPLVRRLDVDHARDAAFRNTVYARLTLDLGPEKVAAMANRLGICSSPKTREGTYVPSMGLGSIGVSPLDLASAYATLAAGGIYSQPMAITKVVLSDGATTGAGAGRSASA